MEANRTSGPASKPPSSVADLLHISPAAVSFFFELAADHTPFSLEEIQTKFSLTKKTSDQYITELLGSGLVRRNPDGTFEAVAPIEATMLILTRIRNLLRQLRKEFPEQMAIGVPVVSHTLRQKFDSLPYQLETLRSSIDGSLDRAFEEFRKKTDSLEGSQTFDAFTDGLYAKIIAEVDERMMEARNQLNEFESIENFITVLNKLKNDVFDIVNISLSDMREQAFRLHELDEFREDLTELWSVTPSIVEGHLSDFEQEMSTLEASLGDLMETKYRLGAFKGVIENFTKDHIMTSVKTLKHNFQLSLTETIQDHLRQTQDRFEEASSAAHREFDKLREQLAGWVRNALDLAFNEVIERNQKTTSDLASHLEALMQFFRTRFLAGLDSSIKAVKLQAREVDKSLSQVPITLDALREKEVNAQIDKLIDQSEKQLSAITHDLPKAFTQWRNDYLTTVDSHVSSLLEEAEGNVTLATQSVNQFWRRSKESEPTTFDLYQFIIGEREFKSYVTHLIAKARSHLLLLLPRMTTATRVTQKLLKMIPGDVRVRIILADPPSTKPVQSFQKVVEKNPNFQIRYDPRGDIWGVIRDFEEIILGNTARGTANVVGIASSHEDHVELFRAVMENRWLHARGYP
ncbi:MAG: hypothetical protein ACFE89_04815 [Candidatus Hodarchaeota archaeon]